MWVLPLIFEQVIFRSTSTGNSHRIFQEYLGFTMYSYEKTSLEFLFLNIQVVDFEKFEK
jgi:hypothetical protein